MADENPFLAESEVVADQPVIAAGVAERFPVWKLMDVVRVAVFFVVFLVLFTVVALMVAAVAPGFRGVPTNRVVTDLRVVLPPQLAAYFLTFWFVYRMLKKHYRVGFLEGIRWRFPGVTAPGFVVFGVVLAIAIAMVQKHVPMPSRLPLNEFFRNQAAAWTFTIFGTLVAPFFEEFFFRGLLFPSLLAKLSGVTSVVVTAMLFALMHGAQLAWAWGPLLLLFTVGAVLTITRWKADSLAASTLVHLSYNLTLFVFTYISTDGFHKLPK